MPLPAGRDGLDPRVGFSLSLWSFVGVWWTRKLEGMNLDLEFFIWPCFVSVFGARRYRGFSLGGGYLGGLGRGLSWKDG